MFVKNTEEELVNNNLLMESIRDYHNQDTVNQPIYYL